jgi:N-acetylmuramoyl-L-alanine amidase
MFFYYLKLTIHYGKIKNSCLFYYLSIKYKMYNKILLVALLIFVALACNNNKHSATNKIYVKQAKAFSKQIKAKPEIYDSLVMAKEWVGTTNFGMRKANFVIIHHTAQNACDSTLRTFTLPRTEVSAHYVICKDGTIHHMLSDYLRAWHAGNSRWGNVTDINSVSIGIELDNNGYENFAEPQMNSLLALLKRLKKNNKIPTSNFIGHADIAPKRKNDPNKYFPWQLLAKNDFGNWYDTANVKVPVHFNALQALRVIGYDTRDSLAAIKAFKLHFMQQDNTALINEDDKKVIFDLSKKY